MKIAIYANEYDESIQAKEELVNKLLQESFEIEHVSPEIVVTIGGDGTVLDAIHHYLDKIDTVKFIGIHTGHLGYYTDWLPHEIDELIEFIKGDELSVEQYPLLQVNLCANNECQKLYALNEMTILNAKRTQHLDITINELFFESFRGTGLCISTPTGSTAYNKSLGGALLYPEIEAFQMTEIASINNNVYRTIGSPLIIPKGQSLSIQSENWENITLTQDHLNIPTESISRIEITLSDKSAKFIKREEALFWKRIKQHFL